MNSYKRTQVGHLVLIITLVVVVLFIWLQIVARTEAPSVDSGANFAITSVMILILFILTSFTTLTVAIDEKYLKIKFGYGIFKKRFLLERIVSIRTVKNHWYHGWGVRVWFWPRMYIYNVSGFDAVEITMDDGKLYRIGTDVPKELEIEIKKHLV